MKFAAFVGKKSSVILVKEMCWTAICARNSFQTVKMIGHKNCGLLKC
jgi:hypothetical protein